MGHRCLVAYENGRQRFDVRVSHWGGHALELRNGITEQTPPGGSAAEYEPDFITDMIARLDSVAEKADMAVEGYLTDAQDDRAVEGEPLARDLHMRDVAALVDECDFHIEALYVVTLDFEVRAFQPLYVGFRNRGSLLVEPRWVGDEPVSNSRNRGWFKGVQTELGQFVDEGIITERQAGDRLVARTLERFAERSNQQVLGHSTTLTAADRERHPLAFVQTVGRTRLHNRGDEMLPTGYNKIEHWEVPEGFDGVLPEPVSEDEVTSLGSRSDSGSAPFVTASETSLNGVTGSFEIGDRAHDRTRNRSGPGSNNTLVVVWKTGVAAADYEIEGKGQTVAEVNPGFNRRDPVLEVVYVNDLPEHIDTDDSEQIAECYQRGDLESAGVSVYAFPESRLGVINQSGETVEQVAV